MKVDPLLLNFLVNKRDHRPLQGEYTMCKAQVSNVWPKKSLSTTLG